MYLGSFMDHVYEYYLKSRPCDIDKQCYSEAGNLQNFMSNQSHCYGTAL